MALRRILIIIAFMVAMIASSCRITREPVRRVLLPTEEEVAIKKITTEVSELLRIPLSEEEDNIGLYAFVADWLGTPYRFGASTRRGTDCSGFVNQLYREVYSKHLRRTSSASLMLGSRRVTRAELQEGDLVFFNINNRTGGQASHVGVYLKSNLFAHASTQNGVIISSLLEPYYRNTFIGGGRLL